MRKFATGLIVGCLLATTGVGIAASKFAWQKTYAGVICGGEKSQVVCARTDGRGYGVGISRDIVAIMRTNGSVVHVKTQP